MGRPSTYTEEIAAEILERLADGETLKVMCRELEHLPPRSTVRGWVYDDVDGFARRWQRAIQIAAQDRVDEIFEIADGVTHDYVMGDGGLVPHLEHINRTRLRVDTRKWYASKILPKLFGDKISHEVTGRDGGPIAVKHEMSAKDAAQAYDDMLKGKETDPA